MNHVHSGKSSNKALMDYGLVYAEDLYTILKHIPSVQELLIQSIGPIRYEACMKQLKEWMLIDNNSREPEDVEDEEEEEEVERGENDKNNSNISANGCLKTLTYGEMLLLLIPPVDSTMPIDHPTSSNKSLLASAGKLCIYLLD